MWKYLLFSKIFCNSKKADLIVCNPLDAGEVTSTLDAPCILKKVFLKCFCKSFYLKKKTFVIFSNIIDLVTRCWSSHSKRTRIARFHWSKCKRRSSIEEEQKPEKLVRELQRKILRHMSQKRNEDDEIGIIVLQRVGMQERLHKFWRRHLSLKIWQWNIIDSSSTMARLFHGGRCGEGEQALKLLLAFWWRHGRQQRHRKWMMLLINCIAMKIKDNLEKEGWRGSSRSGPRIATKYRHNSTSKIISPRGFGSIYGRSASLCTTTASQYRSCIRIGDTRWWSSVYTVKKLKVHLLKSIQELHREWITNGRQKG